MYIGIHLYVHRIVPIYRYTRQTDYVNWKLSNNVYVSHVVSPPAKYDLIR